MKFKRSSMPLIITTLFLLLVQAQNATALTYRIKFNNNPTDYIFDTNATNINSQYTTILDALTNYFDPSLPTIPDATTTDRPSGNFNDSILTVFITMENLQTLGLIFDRSRLYLRAVWNTYLGREYWFPPYMVNYGGPDKLQRATIGTTPFDNAINAFQSFNGQNQPDLTVDLHRLAVFFAEATRYNILRREIAKTLNLNVNSNYQSFVPDYRVYSLVTNWATISKFINNNNREPAFFVGIDNFDVNRWATPRVTPDQIAVFALLLYFMQAVAQAISL
jgi:hypothetical protein